MTTINWDGIDGLSDWGITAGPLRFLRGIGGLLEFCGRQGQGDEWDHHLEGIGYMIKCVSEEMEDTTADYCVWSRKKIASLRETVENLQKAAAEKGEQQKRRLASTE